MSSPPPDERDPARPQSQDPAPEPEVSESPEATEAVLSTGPDTGDPRPRVTQWERSSSARELHTPSPPPRRSAPRPEPEPGPREFGQGDHIGRYIVLGTVGRGGMGVVYAAYDPELDRKVALKLLLPGRDTDSAEGRARLLREAQAMARISHPNVCTVFDVGTIGDQVFLAMEFIEGTTLHKWLKEKPRPWREILRVFLEAGRGLAAAHEVGLVHRDFKPANVLIGKGERPFVTDFGLARLSSVASSDEPSSPSLPRADLESLPGHITSSLTNSALSTELTRGDQVMGTPDFMPPEQYLGQVPDARSDQFSFCATLYKALYNQRAFEPLKVAHAARELHLGPPSGGTQSMGMGSALVGVINEPPAGSKVPAWVRRAVLRGLSLRPSDRFPSIQELLEELAQEPRRIRRRWAIAAGVLAVALAVSTVVQVRRQGDVCAGAEPLIGQTWNPDVRHTVEAAFAATGKPFAHDMAQSAIKVLDAYAHDWAKQHTEACLAARVRGVQTEQLFSLRVVCLERRRKDFQSLAHLLTSADGRLVARSLEAAHSLPSLQECEDIESLTNQVSLPADPAKRAEIEQLGSEVSDVKALGRAGRYDEALKLGQQLTPKVVATSYLPLEAELRASLGWYQQLIGEVDEGARQLEQALTAAEAARADRRRVEALNKLVFVRGIQGKAEQADLLARLSESALKRIGGDTFLSSELMGNLGNVALRQGHYKEAETYFEKTRELQEKVLAADDPQRMKATYALGMAALAAGDHKRATGLFTESLQQMEATLGAKHPDVALCHSMLSWAYRDDGDFEQALAHAQTAVSIRKVAFGEEHPAVADALDGVGMSLIKLKRYDDARKTFESALAMKAKALGPDSLELSFSYDGIGQAMLAAGRPAEAIAPLQKALSFEGVEPEPLAESGFALARALWDSEKDPERAKAEATKARERFAQVGKPDKVAEVNKWLEARQKDGSRRAPPRRGQSRPPAPKHK